MTLFLSCIHITDVVVAWLMTDGGSNLYVGMGDA